MVDETVVRLAADDLAKLSRLCLACTGFYEMVEGHPASDATAAEILGPLAPEYAACVKHVFAVMKDGALIAVIELLQGHPSARDWCIGLLLVNPQHRRRGLGARLCTAILDWIAEHDGAMVRLVVQQQNAAVFLGNPLDQEDVGSDGGPRIPLTVIEEEVAGHVDVLNVLVPPLEGGDQVEHLLEVEVGFRHGLAV